MAVAAALLLLWPAVHRASAAASGPHVVMVMADDMGLGDVGFTGGRARTPHLDALAASPHTVQFTHFHSGGTVCSPTRATVLTGRNHVRECIDSALGCESRDAGDCTEPSGLPTNIFTVADAARSAGMASLLYGKCTCAHSSLGRVLFRQLSGDRACRASRQPAAGPPRLGGRGLPAEPPRPGRLHGVAGHGFSGPQRQPELRLLRRLGRQRAVHLRALHE